MSIWAALFGQEDRRYLKQADVIHVSMRAISELQVWFDRMRSQSHVCIHFLQTQWLNGNDFQSTFSCIRFYL